jgi:uncharacterized membrane protein YfcA
MICTCPPFYCKLTSDSVDVTIAQWSPESIRKLPLHLLGIGALAGAFGVGGEGATSRLLRGVNFTPAAVSAMTATAVFFASGSKCSAVYSILLSSAI